MEISGIPESVGDNRLVDTVLRVLRRIAFEVHAGNIEPI